MTGIAMSRRKRIILLLSALPTVRSNLKSRPDGLGSRGPSSRALLEEHPAFALDDVTGEPRYPFAALEAALQDLKRSNNLAYCQVWRVYCEGQPASAVQQCRAHIGLKTIEASTRLPDYIRLPRELRDQHARPSTHAGKKEQNAWIRELRREGRTHQQIATTIGVTRQRVGQILGEAA